MVGRSLAASSQRLVRASSTMKAVGSLASTALYIAIILCIVGLCNLIGSNPCPTSSHQSPAVNKWNRFGAVCRYTACAHAQNHTKHNPTSSPARPRRGNNRRGNNPPPNPPTLRQYGSNHSTCRAQSARSQAVTCDGILGRNRGLRRRHQHILAPITTISDNRNNRIRTDACLWVAHGDGCGRPGEISHTGRVSRYIHDTRSVPKTAATFPKSS